MCHLGDKNAGSAPSCSCTPMCQCFLLCAGLELGVTGSQQVTYAHSLKARGKESASQQPSLTSTAAQPALQRLKRTRRARRLSSQHASPRSAASLLHSTFHTHSNLQCNRGEELRAQPVSKQPLQACWSCSPGAQQPRHRGHWSAPGTEAAQQRPQWSPPSAHPVMTQTPTTPNAREMRRDIQAAMETTSSALCVNAPECHSVPERPASAPQGADMAATGSDACMPMATSRTRKSAQQHEPHRKASNALNLSFYGVDASKPPQRVHLHVASPLHGQTMLPDRCADAGSFRAYHLLNIHASL